MGASLRLVEVLVVSCRSFDPEGQQESIHTSQGQHRRGSGADGGKSQASFNCRYWSKQPLYIWLLMGQVKVQYQVQMFEQLTALYMVADGGKYQSSTKGRCWGRYQSYIWWPMGASLTLVPRVGVGVDISLIYGGRQGQVSGQYQGQVLGQISALYTMDGGVSSHSSTKVRCWVRQQPYIRWMVGSRYILVPSVDLSLILSFQRDSSPHHHGYHYYTLPLSREW